LALLLRDATSSAYCSFSPLRRVNPNATTGGLTLTLNPNTGARALTRVRQCQGYVFLSLCIAKNYLLSHLCSGLLILSPFCFSFQPLALLLRDANALFVLMNDAMSNTLETHLELDLFGVLQLLPLWSAFPRKARRLIDTQQAAQSLASHLGAGQNEKGNSSALVRSKQKRIRRNHTIKHAGSLSRSLPLSRSLSLSLTRSLALALSLSHSRSLARALSLSLTQRVPAKSMAAHRHATGSAISGESSRRRTDRKREQQRAGTFEK